jgi:hypothetical protein
MPHRWFIALSLAWGLTLGALAAIGTAVTLLGFGWLFLYGDDPWPAGFTGMAVPLAAALAAIGVFGAVLAFAAYLRRTYPDLERRLQASAALRWGALAAPALLIAGLLGAAVQQEREADRARVEAAQAELRQVRAHRLASAAWRLNRQSGQLQIEVETAGLAAGSYALRWQARAIGVAKPLAAGSAVNALPAGPASLTLVLDASGVARSYAEAVMSRPEAVVIDLSLAVELSLALEGLPPLDEGLQLTVPLSFAYQPDGTVAFISQP